MVFHCFDFRNEEWAYGKSFQSCFFRLGDALDFRPVREADGGTYFCWAKNDVGTSDELSMTFDVLYPPRAVLTEPQKVADLDVGKSTQFKCDAQSNPPAKFEWLQKFPDLDNGKGQVFSRGFGKSLLIQNVTYEHEGTWACVATTTIKGQLELTLAET